MNRKSIKKIFIVSFLSSDKSNEDLSNIINDLFQFIEEDVIANTKKRFAFEILEQNDMEKKRFVQNAIMVFDTHSLDMAESMTMEFDIISKVQRFMQKYKDKVKFIMSEEHGASDLVIEKAKKSWENKYNEILSKDFDGYFYR